MGMSGDICKLILKKTNLSEHKNSSTIYWVLAMCQALLISFTAGKMNMQRAKPWEHKCIARGACHLSRALQPEGGDGQGSQPHRGVRGTLPPPGTEHPKVAEGRQWGFEKASWKRWCHLTTPQDGTTWGSERFCVGRGTAMDMKWAKLGFASLQSHALLIACCGLTGNYPP